MSEHARLSPSSSHRWLQCTPSAALERQFPATSTSFSEEGTAAHAIAEQMLLQHLGLPFQPLDEELRQYDTSELREHVAAYVRYAIARIDFARAQCPDPVIAVEKKVDISTWVPECFGTADLLLIYAGVIEIIDLKFGKGVRVDA